jgi:phosphoribosylaminoimidazole-succinocarboxamide synthase
LKLYEEAANYAQTRGVILADTKFEFGLVSSSNGSEEEKELILIDELLTPDSSRYWPLEKCAPGVAQPSFDKQYVRDWLVKAGFRKGLESGPVGKEGQGWSIDEEVVKGTQERYAEAVNLLTRN